MIALTIDDGFVRSTNETNSMVPDVLELLARYGARATFMVCTKYTTRHQVQQVMRTGEHELGNHLYADTPIGWYTNMAKEDFRTAVLDANRYLLDDCPYNNQNNNATTTTPRSIHWFRAPQGAMSTTMREVLYEENMTNVLGDIYCDDWAYAEYNTTNTTGTGGDTSRVAPIMLQQVDTNMRMNNNTSAGGMGGGSVAIFHMVCGLLFVITTIVLCSSSSYRVSVSYFQKNKSRNVDSVKRPWRPWKPSSWDCNNGIYNVSR